MHAPAAALFLNRQGFVTGDEQLLAWLRRNKGPTAALMLVANKADTRAGSNSA
jgi:predicted GTPase